MHFSLKGRAHPRLSLAPLPEQARSKTSQQCTTDSCCTWCSQQGALPHPAENSCMEVVVHFPPMRPWHCMPKPIRLSGERMNGGIHYRLYIKHDRLGVCGLQIRIPHPSALDALPHKSNSLTSRPDINGSGVPYISSPLQPCAQP